jgi:hypothetical protein
MFMNYILYIWPVCLLLIFSACGKTENKLPADIITSTPAISASDANTLFKILPSAQTGIDFSNTLESNDSLNILEFNYFYNGGGVAIGDINNDGLADIYLSGNMVSGKLFLNKGNLQFEDITQKAGVATRNWATGVSMADVNGGRFAGYICLFFCLPDLRNAGQ